MLDPSLQIIQFWITLLKRVKCQYINALDLKDLRASLTIAVLVESHHRISFYLKMAGFVFPEVMRTMSSGDWLNTEESESAEKIVEELQNEGILNENKEYTREIERQDSKEDGGNEKKDATKS